MNFLCRIGIHKKDKYGYIRVRKQRGSHRWNQNYIVCSRCGKMIATFSVRKMEAAE